jgi:hypothetical protein
MTFPNPFPLWIRIAATAWTVVLIPVYWIWYGPTNFLWFSDVTLFMAVANLWLVKRLLASITALIVALPETLWIVDFLVLLVTGMSLTGMTEYMFDAVERPPYLRALSLFHLWMPPLVIYQVWKLGYARRALWMATLIAWTVLLATWLLTGPEDNINWVYGPGEPQEFVPALVYLAMLLAVFPIALFLPPHALFERLFGRGSAPARRA